MAGDSAQKTVTVRNNINMAGNGQQSTNVGQRITEVED
jgi:hypothetical protein